MVVYRRGNRRSIIILLVITAITLITLDVRGSGPLTSLRGGARDLFSPVASVVNTIFSPVGDWLSGIRNAGSLNRENDRLRSELEEFQGQDAEEQIAAAENAELRRLLDLPYVEDADAIAARVVSGSPSNFEWTVMIDRGTSSGVLEGMPVVTGLGLVGRVVEADNNRATVLLLRDPLFGADVAIGAEPAIATGIAQGRTGEDTMTIDLVSNSARVEEGDIVFTSGREEESRYPPGIPIGEVESVVRYRGGIQQEIVVRPYVDLDSIEYVKVIRWPTGVTGDVDEEDETDPAEGEGDEGEEEGDPEAPGSTTPTTLPLTTLPVTSTAGTGSDGE